MFGESVFQSMGALPDHDFVFATTSSQRPQQRLFALDVALVCIDFTSSASLTLANVTLLVVTGSSLCLEVSLEICTRSLLCFLLCVSRYQRYCVVYSLTLSFVRLCVYIAFFNYTDYKKEVILFSFLFFLLVYLSLCTLRSLQTSSLFCASTNFTSLKALTCFLLATIMYRLVNTICIIFFSL